MVVDVEAQAVSSSAAAGTASQRAAKREDLDELILEPGKREREREKLGEERRHRRRKRTRRTADACGVLHPWIVGAGKSKV
jgi:hypothetical protein